MKIKNLFLMIVSLSLSLVSYCQSYTISGYVEDAKSGEKLLAATVYDKITGLGTSTNEYGFYTLTLPENEVSLSVSYVGYTSYGDTLILDKDINMTPYSLLMQQRSCLTQLISQFFTKISSNCIK